MARTRKKAPESAPQPAYAGRLAASIAGLVTVQSSVELAQRVNAIAPEVDELETTLAGRTFAARPLNELEVDLAERVRELEAALAEEQAAKQDAIVIAEQMVDRIAEHATARAALEQELDLAKRELESHLGLGTEGDQRDESAAIEQLKRLGWTTRTSSRGRYELALIKGGDGKDYGGARILELEAQVVDLIAVEGEVIGSLRRANVLKPDETPTTPELVALLKKLRGEA